MRKSLPPLSALRAFEAAARHLSLTKAAAELSVTPGALSHQIRGLEEFLGLRLFDRGVRAIALTAEGRVLFPGLQQGFGHIRDAVEQLRARTDTRVLVISAPPGFTAKWLVPRLYRFAAKHPDIDTRVASSLELASFERDGIDVALRTLPDDAAADPGLVATRIAGVSMIPVCSPRLVDPSRPIRSARDLLRLPLIHDESFAVLPGWADWFRANGVADADVRRGTRFSSPDHSLDAVIEGSGVLLANTVLAFDDLRTGRLVAPLDLPLATNRAYYVVSPRARAGQRSIEAFRAWIAAEASSFGGQLPRREASGAKHRKSAAAPRPAAQTAAQKRPRRRR